MSLKDIILAIDVKSVLSTGGIVIVLAMTVVQLAPVKINPWGWLARKLGKAVNKGEVTKEG